MPTHKSEIEVDFGMVTRDNVEQVSLKNKTFLFVV